jgi:hypothetical protein
MAGLPLPDMSALIRDGHLPFFRCGGKLLRNPLAALERFERPPSGVAAREPGSKQGPDPLSRARLKT